MSASSADCYTVGFGLAAGGVFQALPAAILSVEHYTRFEILVQASCPASPATFTIDIAVTNEYNKVYEICKRGEILTPGWRGAPIAYFAPQYVCRLPHLFHCEGKRDDIIANSAKLYRCIDSRFDDDVYLIPVWLED